MSYLIIVYLLPLMLLTIYAGYELVTSIRQYKQVCKQGKALDESDRKLGIK